MSKAVCVFVLLLLSFVAHSEESVGGYSSITKLYLDGTDYVNFYLDKNCPNGKAYYSLRSNRVDVGRFYSALLAAYMANKKVDVKYESNGAQCEVTRIFIE